MAEVTLFNNINIIFQHIYN